jgi:hypothetical protein
LRSICGINACIVLLLIHLSQFVELADDSFPIRLRKVEEWHQKTQILAFVMIIIFEKLQLMWLSASEPSHRNLTGLGYGQNCISVE